MNRKQRRRSRKRGNGAKGQDSAPRSAASLLDEAAQRFDEGRPAEALALCQDAVAVEPASFAAQANLGNVLHKLGRTDAAAEAYARALAIEPRSAPVLGNLAILKAETADYVAATALYRRILELDPGDAEAYHDLALIKTFRAGDPDIEAMAALRARPDLDEEARMYLDFALAKAFDEIGEVGRAFAAAESANRLKRAGLDYDVARDEALAERIIETFDERLLADAAGGAADETPVFIIGMPRSGTTLVEQIVASHGEAAGAGEVNHLRDVVMGFGAGADPGVLGLSRSHRAFPEGVRDIAAGGLRRLGEAYAARLRAEAPGARRVTDKMPRNFFFVGLIRMALPGARIVHCRRHPMATCLSCYRIHFPTGQEFTYDLRDLGRYYRLYDRLMEHWRGVGPARLLDLRYEDLIAEPEARIRNLLGFLDLPWDDACLAFHKTKRRVGTASAHQVRRPLYGSAVDAWRRYEAHLGPLAEALGPLAAGDG